MGEHQDAVAISKAEMEKVMLEDTIFFIIEKKDETKIGHINGFMRGIMMEISFAVVPSERRKRLWNRSYPPDGGLHIPHTGCCWNSSINRNEKHACSKGFSRSRLYEGGNDAKIIVCQRRVQRPASL